MVKRVCLFLLLPVSMSSLALLVSENCLSFLATVLCITRIFLFIECTYFWWRSFVLSDRTSDKHWRLPTRRDDVKWLMMLWRRSSVSYQRSMVTTQRCFRSWRNALMSGMLNLCSNVLSAWQGENAGEWGRWGWVVGVWAYVGCFDMHTGSEAGEWWMAKFPSLCSPLECALLLLSGVLCCCCGSCISLVVTGEAQDPSPPHLEVGFVLYLPWGLSLTPGGMTATLPCKWSSGSPFYFSCIFPCTYPSFRWCLLFYSVFLLLYLHCLYIWSLLYVRWAAQIPSSSGCGPGGTTGAHAISHCAVQRLLVHIGPVSGGFVSTGPN